VKKHVEDNSVTDILLMNKENCALKLVDEIIVYYDIRPRMTHESNDLLPSPTFQHFNVVILPKILLMTKY